MTVLKGQPGHTYVLEKQWSEEYSMGVADGDGVIRDEYGKSFSGSYEVVAYEDECSVCGSANFNIIKGTAQLVCKNCGHR